METIGMLRTQYGPGQWVLVFYMYSFAGWCWELLLYALRQRRLINRGFLTGPFLPVYGFGAVGMLLVCLPVKESVGKVAIVGAITATALEYAAGALVLRLFQLRLWDYSAQRLNLNGHICLMAVLTWALFAVVVVCILHPLFQPSLSRLDPALAGAAAGALTVFSLGETVQALASAGLKRTKHT